MAHVYKRNKVYWVRFNFQGKEYRRSAFTSSKTVAQQYLAQLMEEKRKIARGGRERFSYQSALLRYSHDYLPTLKPSTQARYRGSFKQLAPFLSKLHLDEISKSVLASFVSARRAAKADGGTIKRDLSALSSLCSYAQAIDMIETNPVRTFPKRHIRDSQPRTSYPTDAEIELLISHAPAGMKRPIRFLAETGMRLEEAISLEWSQVTLHRREVRLTKTKTSSPRIVPLSQFALDTLLASPRHPTSPYVFWHNERGDRYHQFSSHFGRLARKVGFKHRAHDLRHRFASVFLQATQDLAALQAVLGHKSIDMTMRYSHLVTDHLHEAVAKAGSRLGTRTPDRYNPFSEHDKTPTAATSSFTPSWNVTVTTTISGGSAVQIGIGDIGSRKVGVVG